VMPSGVMFWKDVWTIDTMGHRTTTPISAIAGPIQSRGSRAASRRRQEDLAAPGRRAIPDTNSAQLPLLAVCWIAPRTWAGLPVMAWPTCVLIMFSTEVQFASAG